MKKFVCFLTLLLFTLTASYAQKQSLTSSEIYLQIQKLNHLKRVLYLAAHPDDENTRLIAYFSSEEKARTGYLSLTRGDGGQNLIGDEKGSLMGLLRTNELLEARKIDGGEQFFTRAVDFGYSKTSAETFTKWNKDDILSDVIWTIRKFQPDVIITRFPPNSYAGHGHHSSSAILAEEAFDLAGKKSVFPEQLKFVDPWQPKRLYFNSSTWWDKELPEKVAGAPDKYVTIDVGTYNPLIGSSYTEIAAESRTMHKSQGFGSSKARGSKKEYLKYMKGEKAKNNDIFDGVKTGWDQVENGEKVEQLLEKIMEEYDFKAPHRSIKDLLALYRIIDNTENEYWKKVKLRDLRQVILSCLGFYGDLTAEDFEYTPGDSIKLNFFAVNRSGIDVRLNQIRFQEKNISINKMLEANQPLEHSFISVIKNYRDPQPYWLGEPFENIYKVDEQQLIGMPVNDASLEAVATVSLEDLELSVPFAVEHKRTDPVKGEVFRPVHVLPEVTANLAQKTFTFRPGEEKEVKIILKSHSENVASGVINVRLPKGWKADDTNFEYSIKGKNQIEEIVLSVTPGRKASSGDFVIEGEKGTLLRSLVYIQYDHITTQTLLQPCKSKLVLIDVKRQRNKIGYIQGAGDEVPDALVNLGYEVSFIDEKTLETESLDQYETIVTGIRAFNKNKYLAQYHTKLMDYVKNGGNLVVQYCTSHRLAIEQLGPYPMKLGRGRVTVEEAEPKLLNPEHRIFNSPNKITASDFKGWVQERGLYFAKEWDKDKYEALISWNDPEEDSEKGGLIVTQYGKGTFIYTGISFFRELPAGVPGAYKLMTNIIEYKQE